MADVSNPAGAGKCVYRVKAPPSGAEQWTPDEIVSAILGTGAECCCAEIDPSDRPCLICEANDAPPPSVKP